MRYVDESKEVGTKSGRVITWMRIICDTLADLPAPDAYGGITICMGSRAFVIADGSKHVLQSGGQWVQQGASAATYTRGEIDAMVQQINADILSAQTQIDNLNDTKIAMSDVYGSGILIPDNSDLNDYTTGGKYYGGNSAGNTVLNLPVQNGNFNITLTVKRVTPSATIQFLKVCNIANDPYIYIRRRTTSTWQSWYRFEGIQI